MRALAGSGEHPPDAPDLAKFPVESGVWRQVREDLIAGDVARELGADRTLNRTYLNTASGSTADLFVAGFQSQRGGASQPHSPKVCMPDAGWTPESTGDLTIATSAGPIRINRYVVAKGPRRDRRTDTALVRVLTWVNAANDRASADAAEFARQVYPRLRELLPR